MEKKNLGIPVAYYQSNRLPSFTDLSGLFIGYTSNRITSLILSTNLQRDILKAPPFTEYAFTNVSNLNKTFKSFNKILTEYRPDYFYNEYSELILSGAYKLLLKDAPFLNAQKNTVDLHLRVKGIDKSFWIELPAYSVADAANIGEYSLPKYGELKIESKGEVDFEGYKITFIDWFKDHVGYGELIKGLEFYLKRLNWLGTRKLPEGRNRKAS